MRIQIKDNPALNKIFNDLKSVGYSKQEIILAGLRLVYRKEFPVYGSAKKKKLTDETMTDEEVCVDVLGGEIEKENGIKYCVIKQGGMTTRSPLSGVRNLIK